MVYLHTLPRPSANPIGPFIRLLKTLLFHTGCSLSKKDFRPISSAQLPASLLGALYKLQHSFCLSDPNLPDMPIVHASEGFMRLTGRPRYQTPPPVSCLLTNGKTVCAGFTLSTCFSQTHTCGPTSVIFSQSKRKANSQVDGPFRQLGQPGACSLRVLCRDQVVGHNCRFMQGPGTDQNELARLKSAIKDERPMTVSSLLK